MDQAFSPEHNEAQLEDLTIPLFELEQRMERVEQGLQSFQVDMIEDVSESIAEKFRK